MSAIFCTECGARFELVESGRDVEVLTDDQLRLILNSGCPECWGALDVARDAA